MTEINYVIRLRDGQKWLYVSKPIGVYGRRWTSGAPVVGQIEIFDSETHARYVAALMQSGEGAREAARHGQHIEIVAVDSERIELGRLPDQTFTQWWETSEAPHVEAAILEQPR